MVRGSGRLASVDRPQIGILSRLDVVTTSSLSLSSPLLEQNFVVPLIAGHDEHNGVISAPARELAGGRALLQCHEQSSVSTSQRRPS